MSSSLQLALAKLNQRQTRELSVTPKVLSADAGTVEFVASDETLDCHCEIIRIAGWKFTHFAKNAPFVDSHDYSSITKLLGQVIDFRVEKGQLIETVKYSREPGTLADWAFKMVRDGFLRAVSVGFIPQRMVTKWDFNSAEFNAQVGEMKLDTTTAAQLRAVYLEQEQIELSQCVLGANPNALAKAYKAGTLTEEDLEKLSATIAASKNAQPAAISADAGAASPRTKLALLVEIQALLSDPK